MRVAIAVALYCWRIRTAEPCRFPHHLDCETKEDVWTVFFQDHRSIPRRAALRKSYDRRFERGDEGLSSGILRCIQVVADHLQRQSQKGAGVSPQRSLQRV